MVRKKFPLANGLLPFLEMTYKVFVVLFLMDIESVPKVTADDSSTKTKVTHHADVVEVESSQCIDMSVEESLFRSST